MEMAAANIGWVLVSTAMVVLMTPALAFFYGGLVRPKNALNTMMMSFVSLGFVGVCWAVAGYSIAFGDGGALIGDLSFVFLNGVGLDVIDGDIPDLLFMAFQCTFVIITAALISGAIVERMRFGPYLVFICAWSLLVYAPVAHWVWGGGWLASLGALDFAGGTVVHINAGAAAAVAAHERITAARPSCRTTFRLSCSERDCFGSAGSDLTGVVRLLPMGLPFSL